MNWFGVRCVFHSSDAGAYEERVTLWQAGSFEEALRRAEADAIEYAGDVGSRYVGLAQAYAMDGGPTDGAEVFSLIRTSDLTADEYVTRFFADGNEIT
jgi:hypothetical protein